MPQRINKTDEDARRSEENQLSARAYKSKGGLRRILNATRYSLLGVRAAWREEAAFRQELLIGAVMLASLPWVAPSLLFGVLMAASVLLVWCIEMINSAIEALADSISVEVQPALGRAKDMGSAAVMFCLLLVALVWIAGLYLRFVN